MSAIWDYIPLDASLFIKGQSPDPRAFAANRPSFRRSITRSDLEGISGLAREHGIKPNKLAWMAAVFGDAVSVRYLPHSAAQSMIRCIHVLAAKGWL